MKKLRIKEGKGDKGGMGVSGCALWRKHQDSGSPGTKGRGGIKGGVGIVCVPASVLAQAPGSPASGGAKGEIKGGYGEVCAGVAGAHA